MITLAQARGRRLRANGGAHRQQRLPEAVARVMTHKRALPAANSWTDPLVEGFSKLEATYLSGNGEVERNHPVFAFFQARNSQLNRRIFASVGEFSDAKLFGLQIVSVIFLLIEIVALVIGVVLTQAITRTVSSLYRATQFVQEGNFSHRVRVERKDQLGVLGESFNSMTGSISRLINEQKQLQRLENEIFIAREVQDQLFPRGLPQVDGVEVEAICRSGAQCQRRLLRFYPVGDDACGVCDCGHFR